MADSRIRNLTGEVLTADISALLNTLYLAVDDISFTDAKKILLKSILTEAVITANTNNYQAMTPKAFYDSVMTTLVKGIGQLAVDGEITAKTGNNLLTAANQTLMQGQWVKDWLQANGAPIFMHQDTVDDPVALAYQICRKATLAYLESFQITPNLGTGRTVYVGTVDLIVSQLQSSSHRPITANYGRYSFVKGTSALDIPIHTSSFTNFSLIVPEDGSCVKVQWKMADTLECVVSATVNLLIK